MVTKPVVFCEEALGLNQPEPLTPETTVLPFKRFAVSDVMQLLNLHLCKSSGKALPCVPRTLSMLRYPRVSTPQKGAWVIGFTVGKR